MNAGHCKLPVQVSYLQLVCRPCLELNPTDMCTRTCSSPSLPTCWVCLSSCLLFSITTRPSTIPRSRNESGAFSAPGFQDIVWSKMEGVRGLHTSSLLPITTYKATATAKSLQSYPPLYDPIDGSPSGSTVPGIFQARTLEWVAISFSNAWKWKVKVKSLSRVRLPATPWMQPTRLPHPWDFPGKSTGVGCHCPLQQSNYPWIFPNNFYFLKVFLNPMEQDAPTE